MSHKEDQKSVKCSYMRLSEQKSLQHYHDRYPFAVSRICTPQTHILSSIEWLCYLGMLLPS